MKYLFPSGEKNPAKREEVKEKIALSKFKAVEKRVCPKCKVEKEVKDFNLRTNKRTIGVSHWCKKCTVEESGRWRDRNRERDRANSQKRWLVLKELVFNHYSENNIKCICCGEKEIKFLALDHITGGGRQHRKEIGTGSVYLLWLIKNNFPDGYQILCHNCNHGKFLNGGICPHKNGN